jgi:AcrR family transcriptional regulator
MVCYFMKKVSKQEWLNNGLTILSENGEDALRIEILCRELEVTKGSFYHHFLNMEEYIKELMEQWKWENTTSVILEAQKQKDFQAKADLLHALVTSKDQELEVRIRGWSVRNKNVENVLKTVDETRVGFLTEMYREKGIAEKESRDLARIEYAALVGAQYMYRKLPAEEFFSLGQKFQQIITKYIS